MSEVVRKKKAELERVTFHNTEYLYIPSEVPEADAEYGADPALLVPEHLVAEDGSPTEEAIFLLWLGTTEILFAIGNEVVSTDHTVVGSRSDVTFHPRAVAA